MPKITYAIIASPAGGKNIIASEDGRPGCENVASFGHGPLGKAAFARWLDTVHHCDVIDEYGRHMVGTLDQISA